jgi:hypothetical protein
MAYITLAQFKTNLGITDSTDDTIIQVWIDCAQKTIDSYTGRTFEAAADSTKKFTPLREDWGGNLWWDGVTLGLQLDLCQLTSITNGDGNLIPSGAVVLLPQNMPVKTAIKIKSNTQYVWTYTGSPDESISIVGRWAYSITAPADIVGTCYELAKYLYQNRESNPSSSQQIISADGVALAPNEIPRTIISLMSPYVRRSW